MDLSTLILVGSLFFGLVVGDAAFVGNSLYVSITIPASMASAGFSKATAEEIFVAGINRYTQLMSVIPTPSIATSSEPGLAMAMARPLQLGGVVYALQSAVRNYGVVSVTGSVLADGQGPGLKMLVVIYNPPDPPVAISLAQPDGNPRALIEKAARETMVSVGPYKVAITDFEDGISGDPTGFDRCKETIAAGLAQPWDPGLEGATETALLINLRGLLAIREGNLAAAETEFALSKTIPGADKAAYGLAAFNQAFLAIAKQQPAEAAFRYNEGVEHGRSIRNASVIARSKVLAGLIAWSEGDPATAEQDFHDAIATVDDDRIPHLYLAELLADRGDAAGAEAERRTGAEAFRFDPKFPSWAQTIFLLDPVHGGYRPMF